jgi:hypothetical protein
MRASVSSRKRFTVAAGSGPTIAVRFTSADADKQTHATNPAATPPNTELFMSSPVIQYVVPKDIP